MAKKPPKASLHVVRLVRDETLDRTAREAAGAHSEFLRAEAESIRLRDQHAQRSTRDKRALDEEVHSLVNATDGMSASDMAQLGAFWNARRVAMEALRMQSLAADRMADETATAADERLGAWTKARAELWAVDEWERRTAALLTRRAEELEDEDVADLIAAHKVNANGT